MVNKIEIEPASLQAIEANIEAIKALEKYYFKHEAWTEEAILKELPDKFNLSLLLFVDNELVGYLLNSRKLNIFYVHKFVIAPEIAGNGIGSMIMNYIKSSNQMEAIELKVSKTNDKAIRFYQKENFVIANEYNEYYHLRFEE